jgi:hypothetical protein
MPRVTVTAQNLSGSITTALNELTFAASDPANFEQTPWTDGLHIVWRNSHATTPYDATLESAPDALGRDVDLTKRIDAEGWRQTDGYVYFKGENAAVLYAVVKLR